MCGGGGGTRQTEKQFQRGSSSFVSDAQRSLSKSSLGKASVEGFGKAVDIEAPEDPIGDIISSTKGKDTTPVARAPGPPKEEEARELSAEQRRLRLRQRGMTSTIRTSATGVSDATPTAQRTLLGG